MDDRESDGHRGAKTDGGEGRSGWISCTGSSWVGLPKEQRDRARRAMIDRHRERGPLMAVVSVRVYENGAEPQLTFTEECTLGVETERATLAGVVARARESLAGWR